jgi:predicted NBD/HSP70 family sugar kinase
MRYSSSRILNTDGRLPKSSGGFQQKGSLHQTGLKSLVALTISEGIGSGVITTGQFLRGPAGMAGEFAHIPLEPTGPLCSCGNRDSRLA